MAHGRSPGSHFAVESSAGSILLAGADHSGYLHVPGCTPVAAGTRCPLCRRALRGKPLSPGHRLLAKRLRGAARGGITPITFAGNPAAQEFWIAACFVPGSGFEHGMAGQCARGCDGSLFRGSTHHNNGAIGTFLPSRVANRACRPAWSGPGIVLSGSDTYRNAMDQYQPGSVARVAASGQFPVRYHPRSRTRPLQSVGLDGGGHGNSGPGRRDLANPRQGIRRAPGAADCRLGLPVRIRHGVDNGCFLATSAEVAFCATAMAIAVMPERCPRIAIDDGGAAMDMAGFGGRHFVGYGRSGWVPNPTAVVGSGCGHR